MVGIGVLVPEIAEPEYYFQFFISVLVREIVERGKHFVEVDTVSGGGLLHCFSAAYGAAQAVHTELGKHGRDVGTNAQYFRYRHIFIYCHFQIPPYLLFCATAIL